MKLQTKLTLNVSIAILIAIVCVSAIPIYFVKKQELAEIDSIRKEEYQKNKDNLKNYVDMIFTTLEKSHAEATDPQLIQKKYAVRLKNVIDLGNSIIQTNIKKVESGEMTEEEAKKTSMEEIRKLRYMNGTGYMWINNTARPYPTMLMHPAVPSMQGQVMDNPKYNTAMGIQQNIFSAMLDVCDKQGEGIIYYSWPKPGHVENQLKLSYVKKIDRWGWILGTGFYVDDVIAEAQAKCKAIIETMRYGKGYFWINDMGTPYPKMIMHPVAPLLNGKIMDAEKYNCAKDNQSFFQAMVEKCNKQGEGYVEYKYPKPGVDGKVFPKLSYVKLFKPWGWVIGTGVYIDDIENKIQAKASEVDRLILIVVVVAFVILLISIIATRLLATSITQKLGGEPVFMANLLDKVADGDFTIEFDDSKEYLGLLGNIKKVVNDLSGVLTRIKDNAQIIDESADKVEDTSSNLANGMERISKQSNNVAGATEEMSVNINAMASAAEEMSVNAGSVAKGADQLSQNMTTVSAAVEEISVSINGIAEGAGSNAELATNASKMSIDAKETMSKLGGAATAIGQVTEMIKRIAEQTNLLALNATIEAASAGEAGKGFAVVANEIKTLAKQSTQNAEDISVIIDGIQDNTNNAVTVITEISDAITTIQAGSQKTAEATQEQTKAANNIAENVGSATMETNSIANSIAEVAKGAEDVSSNSSEAALAVNDISSNILKVSEDSNAALVEIKTVEETANSLNKITDELQDIIAKFTLSK